MIEVGAQPPARLRVAAAAYPLDAVQSLDAWADKLETWVADGAATGADLLVFPEYGLIELAAASGPKTAADLQRTLAAVADHQRAVDAHLRALADRFQVHILGPSGPSRRADQRFENAAALVTPSGAIGRQAKRIMTPFEQRWGIVPGAALNLFETRLGPIGIAICYDSEFPLLVRALVDAGARLLLVPSCTEHPSGHARIRTSAMARALESTIATVVSPTVGEALWSPAVDRNAGAAGIFVPAERALSMTGVLAEGAMNGAGWVVADVDFAALDALRTNGEMSNRADWHLQPGAPNLAAAVHRIDLR